MASLAFDVTNAAGVPRRKARRLQLTPDELLIEQARQGDDGAFAELWRRHAKAARVAARSFRHLDDPDAAVTKSFAALRRELGTGGSPAQAYRPSLYALLRDLAQAQHADVRADALPAVVSDAGATERGITATVYLSLPVRWRVVLWYTDVEGLSVAAAGELMGVAPRVAAALAARARVALRDACLAEGLGEVVDRLPEILLPLVLGSRAALAFRERLAAGADVTAAPKVSAVRPTRFEARRILLVGGATLVVAGAVLVSTLSASAPEPSSSGARAVPGGDPPTGLREGAGSARTTAGTSAVSAPLGVGVPVAIRLPALPSEAPTVSQEPGRDLRGAHPGPPLAVAPSSPTPYSPTPSSPTPAGPPPSGPTPPLHPGAAVPESPPSAPGAPTPSTLPPPVPAARPEPATSLDGSAPAAPTVTSDWTASQTTPLNLAGTAEPGATVTVSTVDGSELCAVTADDTGRWSTGPLSGVAPSVSVLDVTATDAAGNVSQPTTLGPFAFVPVIGGPAGGVSAGDAVRILLSGWPGGKVALTLDGYVVGSFVIGADGTATLTASGPDGEPLAAGSHTVTATYADPGGISAGAASATFEVTTP